jgi:hypothetical protein
MRNSFALLAAVCDILIAAPPNPARESRWLQTSQAAAFAGAARQEKAAVARDEAKSAA